MPRHKDRDATTDIQTMKNCNIWNSLERSAESSNNKTTTFYIISRNTNFPCDARRREGPLSNNGQSRSRSVCASVQSDLSILYSSNYTIISIHSVSGQRRCSPGLITACVVRKLYKGPFCALGIMCFWYVHIVAVKNCLYLHNITKTRLYNFDPLEPHFYIVKLGFTGVYIIFLISAQNIDCGYSLEPPRRGGSNEYPQSMFWAEIWKNIRFFSLKIYIFWW